MRKYSGRKAVVTGGTHGMGMAVVEALLDEGVEVMLTGRDARNVEAARRRLGSRAAHVVRSDAASIPEIDALAAAARATLGGIDLLVVNAGFASLEPFDRVTEASYDRTFGINARGAYFAMQRLAPLIRDGGAIVVTTSIAGETGTPGMSVYAGAKAALRAFARSFAAELLPRGIRVNAVSPGFIKTPTLGLAEVTAEERAEFERLGDEITPMRRHGTPEEIARAMLFLAFEATFTTGVELAVDGGLAQALERPAA